jgi:hypothetical protein
MTAKTFEVRDRGTFIAVLTVRLDPDCEADRYLLARSGFGITPERQRSYVMVAKLDGGVETARTDPYGWPSKSWTMTAAHIWIIDHFDELESGAVIDVEFNAGLTPTCKISEAFE